MPSLSTLSDRNRRLLSVLAVVILIGLGFVALERLTHELSFAQVRSAIHSVTATQVALALLLTAASYLVLTFYDALALAIIGKPLPWRTAALASFTSYTLSHNLGLSLITGGSARYRIYSQAGLDGPDVARVTGIASATFWWGVLAVAGAALALNNGPLSLPGITLSMEATRATGVAIILANIALIALCGSRRGKIGWRGFSVPLPTAGQAIAQIAVAVIDITLASAALFVLVPGADLSTLPPFILAYALAIIAGVITHVPGGVGVFEAVVLAVLPGDKTQLFAALIAYRVIYYLVPLALGIVALTWHASARRRGLLAGVRTAATNVAPLVLSVATFMVGAMLLLSSALPAKHLRLSQLTDLVPLPLTEASHIAASLIGATLLMLAPGLYRRLDGAFVAVRMLLLAAALFSFGKGFDYEEALVCLALAGLLQWTRGAFFRHTALTQQPLSTAWFASVAMVLGLSIWAGFFAYRRIPYDDDLWLKFALHGDAPRFMRASLGVGLLMAGAAIWRLMAPARVDRATPPSLDDLATVRAIIDDASRTEAMLAMVGDKMFLIADTRDAFLMYQVRGSSWVVMGDPVGEPDAWPDLLWRIRDLADRHQGRLMLYEVSKEVLDLAIGMGLQVVKYGEEAVVDLAEFTLDTPRMRGARRSANTVGKRGATLRIVPVADVPAILDELEAVSDEWMETKGQREKGFSLGRFDRDYMRNFDIAVVEIDGRISAFANLWLTANKREASVDLMRHRADTPSGTMDFLFVQLILWAREQGYERFSLGMAPLSGIHGRRLAPTWAKIASLAFRHGERFYGFKGLRTYKEKFDPDWEPRYIAGPQGIGLIRALRDLSRLVNNPRPVSAETIPAHALAA